jgi:outer membrane protein assembly factor BamB
MGRKSTIFTHYYGSVGKKYCNAGGYPRSCRKMCDNGCDYLMQKKTRFSIMQSRSSPIHTTITIVLVCLLLAACSGESARVKRQAEQFMAEGHLPEAVLTYRQALISRPDDPELLRGLGTALAAQGRGRSAAGVLIQVASLKPGDASNQTTLAKLVTQPQDGLDLTLAWITTTAGSEPVGMAAEAGRIFVAYADGRLWALDQGSGHEAWDAQAPDALTSAPAADSGQVWVGAGDGSIFIFDAGSGKILGSYHTGGAVMAAPLLTADMAYCSSNDGFLYALSRGTGTLAWKAEIGSALHASPVVGNGAVYVGANDGRLYGFQSASGERLWLYGIPTQGAVESVPSLANGRIFFGSGDGRIYALDAETGGEYWHYSTPDAVYARPLVLNDQLITASSGLELASIGVSDGRPSWSVLFEHPITEAPAFFKGRLYLFSRGDPRLFAVEARSGKLLGELNSGDWIAQGPLVSGADLILVGKDGSVFLYR